MKPIFGIFFCIVFCCSVNGQNELDRVRKMFSKPNAYVPVQIWKGHLYESHPVEFFIGERNGEVFGYYRIISSGSDFILEGEKHGNRYYLTEYNKDHLAIGKLVSSDLSEFKIGNKMDFDWTNIDKTDKLYIHLEACLYSDFPKSIVKTETTKYSRSSRNQLEFYMIEKINEDEVIVHYNNEEAQESHHRTPIIQNNPLNFSIDISGEKAEFDVLNNKLRRRYKNEFQYYEIENVANYKKIAFAADHFLADVDYFVTGNKFYDNWIEDYMEKSKSEARKEVKSLVQEAKSNDRVSHYKYKWEGWMEIDYFGAAFVSGRIVFLKSWEDELEVIPFNFDFSEGELFTIESQFKRDFELNDYLEKYIYAEMEKLKLSNTFHDPNLKKEDFKYYTLSDNNLIISNTFNHQYGYQKFKIPYSELKGLVKRNSVLKTLMQL